MRNWFFIFCFLALPLVAKETGTLVVSYRSDNAGKRLDRIRFWVRDHKHRQRLYPQGFNFTQEDGLIGRKVIINDLEPGTYTLEFLIPNRDAYFEKVHPRFVTINGNDTVRIDQIISARNDPTATLFESFVKEYLTELRFP